MHEDTIYPFQLFDVRLFEASIKRFAVEDDNSDAEAESNQPEEDVIIPLSIEARMGQRIDDLISVFLDFDIKGPLKDTVEFQIQFTLEGMFEAKQPLDEIEEELWDDFQQRSSISLLWPHARELTSSFVDRMRADLPLLPTMNRLDFSAAAVEDKPVSEE